ncbi:DUF1127 domain-containing protein [Thioalbus denitrificans]|uniref:Uncharacterized protein DUF1127 n=1 Tax=Thioalbus denitrificans TaxID=547122 RepID=A0A369CE98_9GAMM|nr:DUF1127 domain-containing protein [Thioalbus denitrificans]RCX32350.1 uncharacterized protein DUF1127 [Thioalbus denitrificans]
MNVRVLEMQSRRGWWSGAAESATRVLHRGIVLLLEWNQRARQRRQLARLDDYLLRDIGLSRVDAEQEARKPFWRG